MNKKKVDSILKGITAAGIAMGGVSSIQGADMVMAAINELTQALCLRANVQSIARVQHRA